MSDKLQDARGGRVGARRKGGKKEVERWQEDDTRQEDMGVRLL